MKWQPYPAYKDSGIGWLGKIPEHWETQRLKYLSSLNDENLGENTDADYEMLYVDISSIDTFEGIQSKEPLRFGDAPSRAKRIVRHGDVIVSTVRTYLRAIAPIVNPEANLIVSTGFAVIRPNNRLDSNFASYALRAPYFVETVVAYSVGVSYPAVNASDLMTFRVAFPSKAEQRTIGTFLDHESEHIDALIAGKERQIKLLQEKRNALVNHAVTKGLNPNAPMKDTGIEWLGEIPEHWKKNKVKYLADYINGYAFKPSDWSAEGKEIIRIQNLTSSEVTCNRFPDQLGECYLVRKGDILLSWSASLGVYVWDRDEGWLNQHIFKVIPNPQVIDKCYYLWLSKWFIIELQKEIHGSTMQHLTKDKFGGFVVYLPPFFEQHSIAAFLDHESEHIDALIVHAQKAIALLREYRTALISAAVTGRIDVRKEVS